MKIQFEQERTPEEVRWGRWSDIAFVTVLVLLSVSVATRGDSEWRVAVNWSVVVMSVFGMVFMWLERRSRLPEEPPP